jgi:Holliday junction DNA helicase RuvA
MIGQLRGTLLDKTPPWVLLDVAGVGYELQVPLGTLCALPGLGTACTLHTHLVVREDGHHLYGFGSKEEKLVFKTLIKISGIGPRTALAILSSMTPLEFMLAIQEQNPGQLVRVPGIGKKTAERVLLELKELKSLHALKEQLELNTTADQGQNLNPSFMTEKQSKVRIRAEIEQALCAFGVF